MKKQLFLLSAALLMTGCSTISESDYYDLQKENEELKDQIDQLQEDINQLKNEVPEDEEEESKGTGTIYVTLENPNPVLFDNEYATVSVASVKVLDYGNVTYDDLNINLSVTNKTNSEIWVLYKDVKFEGKYSIQALYTNESYKTAPDSTSVETISISLKDIETLGNPDWSGFKGTMLLQNSSGQVYASVVVDFAKNLFY